MVQPLLGKGCSREAIGEGGPLRPPSLSNSRSDASREELAELAQQANPEEIQLGEEEDEDEMDLEPNGQWPAQGPGSRAEVGHSPPHPQGSNHLHTTFPHRSPTGTAERAGCCVWKPKGRLTPSTPFFSLWSHPCNTAPLCTSLSQPPSCCPGASGHTTLELPGP